MHFIYLSYCIPIVSEGAERVLKLNATFGFWQLSVCLSSLLVAVCLPITFESINAFVKLGVRIHTFIPQSAILFCIDTSQNN